MSVEQGFINTFGKIRRERVNYTERQYRKRGAAKDKKEYLLKTERGTTCHSESKDTFWRP